MAKKTFFALAFLALLLSGLAAGAEPKKIGALGRFIPKGGVIDLSGPQGDTISEILVKAGDKVVKGQPLVVFASSQAMRIKLSQAESALRMARDEAVSSVELAKAQVESAAQDVAFSKMRYENFGESVQGSLARQQIEQRKHAYLQAKNRLGKSRLELQRAETQTRANMEKAKLDLDMASENLARSTLLAPSDGSIIEVLRQPGERSGGPPILKMGDLASMFVKAEIYEGDILKLKKGVHVSITSSLLPKGLTGKVHSIGRIISPKNKVADVMVGLDDSETASRLINMEVDVSIKLP